MYLLKGGSASPSNADFGVPEPTCSPGKFMKIVLYDKLIITAKNVLDYVTECYKERRA